MKNLRFLKRTLIVGLLLILAISMYACKEGPIGPPIFFDEKGGYLVISAPVWGRDENRATEYAHRACLSHYFNASAVEVNVSGPRFVNVVGKFNILTRPRWITIHCSP